MEYRTELRKSCFFFVAVMVTLSGAKAEAGQIVNGDFERGDLSGWSSTGNVQTVSLWGSYTAEFNRGDTQPNGVLSQSFSTSAGVVYELIFDFGVYTGHSRNQTLEVEVIGLATLLSLSVSDSQFVSNSPLTFQMFSFLFTADSSTAVLTFRDSVSNYTYSTDCDIDNVQVSAVPEIDPATGGSAPSLVAGVLAMIEQRRRRGAVGTATAA